MHIELWRLVDYRYIHQLLNLNSCTKIVLLPHCAYALGQTRESKGRQAQLVCFFITRTMSFRIYIYVWVVYYNTRVAGAIISWCDSDNLSFKILIKTRYILSILYSASLPWLPADCRHPGRCCTCGNNGCPYGNCSCSREQSRHRNTNWNTEQDSQYAYWPRFARNIVLYTKPTQPDRWAQQPGEFVS